MLNVDEIRVNGSVRNRQIKAPTKGGATAIVNLAKKAMGINISGSIKQESDMIIFTPNSSNFIRAIVITASM